MRQWFVFDNYISKDFNVYISGHDTFNAPSRDVDSVSVAGRNGDLTIDNGRYDNIKLKYPAFIYDKFDANVAAFRNMLLNARGYKRLEDTYHPDEFRLARYDGGFSTDVVDTLNAGEFDITFDCYPQRFLKSGEAGIEFTSNGSIKNETMMTALPLVRVYGTGTLTINSISIAIASVNAYTDIDCDLQEAYEDTLATNRNSAITLTDGKFWELPTGINTISFTGLTKVIIHPRWWIL